jgi:hypothetical protein
MSGWGGGGSCVKAGHGLEQDRKWPGTDRWEFCCKEEGVQVEASLWLGQLVECGIIIKMVGGSRLASSIYSPELGGSLGSKPDSAILLWNPGHVFAPPNLGGLHL